MHYSAPTYNVTTKEWSTTDFQTKKEYLDFVLSHFKYPGEYNLSFADGYWNSEGNKFLRTGVYNSDVPNSIDFRKYWNFEKEKCKDSGIIIYVTPNGTYVVPGLYYWYLNYTPIYDKVKKKITFAEIWDGDLHTYMALLLCILTGRHFVCLKKRQFGMSLKLTSVLLNGIWFGEASKVKIFSHAPVHMENSWIFLEQYRDHINKNCGWKRGFEPNKFLDWQVRRRKNDGSYVGNMSILKGLSTERDASKPVGGGITYAFGEEAGINPNLHLTHEYALPAVGIGSMTTGLLMYSGSVGELDKCEPLKKFMMKPYENGFYAFENRCEGDEDIGLVTGFFVPEWWNYIGYDEETGEQIRCFDQDGNTQKEKALAMIVIDRKKAEAKDPESFRHHCSQRPLSIHEAFSYRKENIFPAAMLSRQEYRINRGDYPFKIYDLKRNADGKPEFVATRHAAIEKFPYSPRKDEIPYGVVKVWEDPIENAPFGTYYASVDPISVDFTSTSESLFSVLIYKNLVEVKYQENGETKTRLEGDRIVASYIGRRETVEKTNELGCLLIERYNAFAVVENNVDNFIKYMISKHKQKHLATKADLPFLKELSTNTESFQEYGVRTNPVMWAHYVNKIREYIKEEVGTESKNDGSVLRIKYGVEKIPDLRLVKELSNFTDIKGNYDQIVTFGLVLSLAKARQANGLITKVIEEDVPKPDRNLYNRVKTPFRNTRQDIRRPFKNLK